MHRILTKITTKTLVAAASSLAMVGTAGAALGTSFSVLSPTDTTAVETTLVDTTAVDTTSPETTIVDTTSPETTVLDTIVDTTLPDGADGLCEAWEKAGEHGDDKDVELESFGRVADAAAGEGVSVDAYCDGVLETKHADDDDDEAEDEAVEDEQETEDHSGSSSESSESSDSHDGGGESGGSEGGSDD